MTAANGVEPQLRSAWPTGEAELIVGRWCNSSYSAALDAFDGSVLFEGDSLVVCTPGEEFRTAPRRKPLATARIGQDRVALVVGPDRAGLPRSQHAAVPNDSRARPRRERSPHQRFIRQRTLASWSCPHQTTIQPIQPPNRSGTSSSSTQPGSPSTCQTTPSPTPTPTHRER